VPNVFRHYLFNVSDQEFQKKAIVADTGFARISPTVSTPSFWGNLLNPGQKPLAKGSIVKEISIDYKRNSISVYKWKVDWLVIIFVLSIIFAFALKGLFKVEI
jgi:hypothetical protein